MSWRRHGTTRWHIFDWRKQLRKGNLVLPESVAALANITAPAALKPCWRIKQVKITPYF